MTEEEEYFFIIHYEYFLNMHLSIKDIGFN